MITRCHPFLLGLLVMACSGCVGEAVPIEGLSSFRVEIIKVNGTTPPADDAPLPANRGTTNEDWEFTIEARDPTGQPIAFDGTVRISVQPGSIVAVTGEGAFGRNISLRGGRAIGTATVTGVYGPSRLWVEDLGYIPANPGEVPACGNGVNDDEEDVLIDFPADPGCAFADDSTEEGGTFGAGVSPPVAYALPRITDIQGEASQTPYPFEGMQVSTDAPQHVIVTRVASDGFYVTDLLDTQTGYNHIFAFNFNTPVGMRVCDQVEYLSGTVNEFFGFTELSFPSYRLNVPPRTEQNGAICQSDTECYPNVDTSTLKGDVMCLKATSGYCTHTCQTDADCCAVPGECTTSIKQICSSFDSSGTKACFRCEVPDPIVLDTATINDPVGMEKVESGLVRVEGFRIAENFGPKPMVNNVPGPDQSNCDLNGDGQVDFESPTEGGCSNVCSADPNCSEWTAFSARGNYKVSRNGTMIQINTGTVGGFDPVSHKGQLLDAVTGTLRNFSGGSLNWTIETRCSDDLACPIEGCVSAPVSAKFACVRLRSINDNDSGSN